MEDNIEELEQKSAVVSYLLWIPFILLLLYAVIGCYGIGRGYTLVLYHGWLQSAMVTVLLLTTAIIAFRRKITLDAREQVVLNLLLPMTIWFQIYLIMMYFEYDGYIQLIICLLSGLTSIICLLCLFFRYRFCIPLKIIFGLISAVLMVIWFLATCFGALVVVVGIFESVFGEFGKTSVVKQVPSPNQNYIAEVVDVDQGALGGDTLVNIKKSGKEISVLLGKLVPDEENVYEGNWGEFETMVIEWKDNHTLVIDGKEYTVDLVE